MLRIFRYNLDWKSLRLIILLESISFRFLIYFLIMLRSEATATLLVVISSYCGNHQSQRPMTTQQVNLLSRYNVGSLQENSTGNYNSILPTIYISIYGLYYDCTFYPNVYALSSYLLPICLMSYYSFTIYLPQGQHAIYIYSDVIF